MAAVVVGQFCTMTASCCKFYILDAAGIVSAFAKRIPASKICGSRMNRKYAAKTPHATHVGTPLFIEAWQMMNDPRAVTR